MWLVRTLFLGSKNVHIRSCSTIPSFPSLHHLLSSQTPDLQSLCRHHALIAIAGLSSNPFFAAKLIALYAAFASLESAHRVFHFAVAHNPSDTFLWNSIIKCHFSYGDYVPALTLFQKMRSCGVSPNEFTIAMVVSASAEVLSVAFGECVHGLVSKFGLLARSSAGVGSSLVYMYCKFGCVGDAFTVFDEMFVRDVVSWTMIVVGCVQNEEYEMGLVCLKEMHRLGEDSGRHINSRTMNAGLQACGNIGALMEGKCLHGLLLKFGIQDHDSSRSSLLSMYYKCESLDDVAFVFQELLDKDVVSWTLVILSFGRKGRIFECLSLFNEMQQSGVEPDGVLLSCILSCVANYGSVSVGKIFHGIILRKNFELNNVVENALITLYCKFELLSLGRRVFNAMQNPDADSWSIMVSGCRMAGLDMKCLDLFRKMQNLGFIPHLSSFVSVILSCAQLGVVNLGRSIHGYKVRSDGDGDQLIANALVGMYGKCGRLDVARKIFDRTTKDIVTWNTFIAAHVLFGYSDSAISLFHKMISEGMKPNSATLLSVLSACSDIAALRIGESVHKYMKELGLQHDVSLCTALVDMYAKCGQLEIARLVFDSIHGKDVVSWNVMISGYGIHGDAEEALHVLWEMENLGVQPNSVTFLAALSACSHAGLVAQGKELFDKMRKYSISPTLKHYSCMVDLLGRSGNLNEAENIVLTMPFKPDGAIWGSLLGACKMHNDMDMGQRVAKRAFAADPENDGYYVLTSNIYGGFGQWNEVERMRGLMRNKGIAKRAGWSSMELGETVHVFTVGDTTSSHNEEMYRVLNALYQQMGALYQEMSGFSAS